MKFPMCNNQAPINTGIECALPVKGDSKKIKLLPVLFSPPMVKAIMGGTKTLTRRIVKGWALKMLEEGFTHEFVADPGNACWCPYDEPGAIIWVKETHYRHGIWAKNGKTKKGRIKWEFIQVGDKTVHYYENPPEKFRKSRATKNPHTPQWYKRSSLFMPFSLARNFLVVKNIRVERLQAITEEDAIKEGIESTGNGTLGNPIVYRNYLATGAMWLHSTNGTRFTAKESFKTLWIKINGEGSYAANPWVWVITFEKIDINFLPKLLNQ